MPSPHPARARALSLNPLAACLAALLGATDAPATGCDVTVSGTPSQVYLWLWNRPATVEITGEPAVAERWKRVRVRWS